jgi:hypothetical protein
MGLTADEIAAWVRRSCDAQGLPVRVRDPATIERVRILLGGAPAEAWAPARSASTGSAGARLQPPDGIDSIRADRAGAVDTGSDDRVVKNSAHDRCLSTEIQSFPLRS